VFVKKKGSVFLLTIKRCVLTRHVLDKCYLKSIYTILSGILLVKHARTNVLHAQVYVHTHANTRTHKHTRLHIVENTLWGT